MAIGPFKCRVQLQSASEARDAHGQPIKTWTTQRTVWARIRPIRGSEAIQAGQLAATGMYQVTVRYEPQLTEDWRVVYGDKTFHIEHAADINEGHTMHELTCRETT